MVCRRLFTTVVQKVKQIGLYDVDKLDQDSRFTLFLARHRFIHTQPLTVLKVYHLDVYATPARRRIACARSSTLRTPCRLLERIEPRHTGDMFAWNDDCSSADRLYPGRGGFEWLLDEHGERRYQEQKTRIIKGVANGLAHARARRHHRDVRPRMAVRPGRCRQAG